MRLSTMLAVMLLIASHAFFVCGANGGTFVPPLPQTIRQHIEWSDGAVVARLVPAEKGQADPVTYSITAVLKQPVGKALQEGDRLTFSARSREPAEWLLATADKDSGGALRWSDRLVLTQAGAMHAVRISELRASKDDIVKLCLSLIEAKDPIVKGDVHAELRLASLRELILLRQEMDSHRLHKLFLAPATPVDQVVLYGLLLGVCGGKDNEELLRDTIVNRRRRWPSHNGVEHIMCGYLLLSGNEGLATLTKHTLLNKEGPLSEKYAALHAITRIVIEAPECVDRDQLCATLHSLLDRPDLADLVIPRLTMLKDWTVQDRLVRIYKDAGDDGLGLSTRREIVKFMEASREDVPDGAITLPRHAVAADEFLKSLLVR